MHGYGSNETERNFFHTGKIQLKLCPAACPDYPFMCLRGFSPNSCTDYLDPPLGDSVIINGEFAGFLRNALGCDLEAKFGVKFDLLFYASYTPVANYTSRIEEIMLNYTQECEKVC